MSPSDTPLESRLFDGLSPVERRVWMDAARSRSFVRDETVARQGEPADWFYLVESGFLKLIQLSADGRELIVRLLGAGEPFGGVVALDKASYPVTAIAVEPTRLVGWHVDVVRPLLQQFPQVRANIMREMALHMSEALTRVRELSTERVGQRLARTLLRLTRQVGRPVPGGMLLTHALTRQELADLTGTTLFTVSRTLSQWTANGILGARGRRVIVRDPTRLEEIAASDEES